MNEESDGIGLVLLSWTEPHRIKIESKWPVGPKQIKKYDKQAIITNDSRTSNDIFYQFSPGVLNFICFLIFSNDRIHGFFQSN